jgi:2-dehydropantoate 2-reductase
MGTLLAASLARAGHPVTLLDHDPARAARTSAQPLELTTPTGEVLRVVVPVTTTAPAGVEVAFLCVKTSATEAALEPLRDLTCTVAVLQNGCERTSYVAGLGFGARVVGIATTEGATRSGEGRVHHTGVGSTQVGAARPEGAPRAERVAELLSSAGFQAEVGDARGASWRKLVVNAAINALTGLLDCPNGQLLVSQAAGELADSAAREVAALASALGIPGDWDPAEACAAWREVARQTSANISSTLQDLRRSQTTEVHAINGAVARLAAEQGLAAPTNSLLCQLVAAREELAV